MPLQPSENREISLRLVQTSDMTANQRFLWNLMVVSMAMLYHYRGAPGEARTLA